MSTQAECSTCGMGRTGAVRGGLRGQLDARGWGTICAALHESGRARTQWRFIVALAHVDALEADELGFQSTCVLGKRRINSRCGVVSGVSALSFCCAKTLIDVGKRPMTVRVGGSAEMSALRVTVRSRITETVLLRAGLVRR